MFFIDTFTFFTDILVEGISKTCVYLYRQFERDKSYAGEALSHWFWRSISTLPENYFPKDITQVNYFDKCFWQGVLNDELESLEEQLSESTKSQFGDVRDDLVLKKIEKPRAKVVAGLSQHALLEQLIQLQGIVGKYMLSPICYEEGLDHLKQALPCNERYITAIEKARHIFRSELKEQPALLSECLQGDLIHLFQELHHKNTLTPMALKNILTYYKPLMAKKTYIKYHNWIKECYNTQSLLSPPIIKRYKLVETLANKETKNEEDNFIWNCSAHNFINILWNNAGKLMSLGLLGQITIIQASGTTQQNYNSSAILPNKSTITHSTIETNQAFVNTPHLHFKTFQPTPYRLVADKFAEDEINVQNKYDFNNTETFGQSFKINQKLKQGILHQFDRVNDDLQELIEKLSVDKNDDLSVQTVLSRGKRSVPPFAPRTECSVSTNKLIELKNTIHDLLSDASKMVTDSTCDFNAYNTDNCAELLKLIKCGVSHLRNRFLKAFENETSLNQYNELNIAYNGLLVEMQKISDKVKLQVAEKYQKELNKLYTDLQELQRSLTHSTEQLTENTKRLCIAEIGHGHIETAVLKFEELYKISNYSLIRDIIEISFRDYGKVDNFDNLLSFIQKLPLFAQLVEGYEALHDIMGKNTPGTLILEMQMQIQRKINSDSKFSDKQELLCRLNILNNKILKSVNEIIGEWAIIIRGHNCKKITNYTTMNINLFYFNSDKLIEKAYDRNLENVEKIIRCTQDLGIEMAVLSVTSLYKEMKRRDHLNSPQLLMLLYYVKMITQRPYYLQVPQIFKKKLDELKDNIPNFIKELIWDGNYCTIEQPLFMNEYLAAVVDEIDCENLRRAVAIWAKTSSFNEVQTCMKNFFYWKITAEENGKYFTVKSVYPENKYLCVLDPIITSLGEYFTWTTGSYIKQTKWEMVPLLYRSRFLIKDEYTKEYLLPPAKKAPESLHHFTGIFTLIRNQWNINCSQHVPQNKPRKWNELMTCFHRSHNKK